MKYAIPAACLAFSLFTTAIGSILSVDAVSKIPQRPKTQYCLPSEFSSLTSPDGKRWAIVKVWGYTYNPYTAPSTDLDILIKTLATNQYDYVLLESEQKKPVRGYYLTNKTGLIPQPVTDEMLFTYPEFFNPGEQPCGM